MSEAWCLSFSLGGVQRENTQDVSKELLEIYIFWSAFKGGPKTGFSVGFQLLQQLGTRGLE